MAFTDPSQIDSRVPTYAWHVAAGGAVDPERYQQYPGTPQTLSAWIAWFDRLPATDAAAPSPPRPGPPLPLALTTAGVAGALLSLSRRRGVVLRPRVRGRRLL